MFYILCFSILLISVHAEDSTEKKTVKYYDPPSNDVEKFRALLKEAKNIIAITGAGISSVPANTESWTNWRIYDGYEIDSPYTLENLPFLLWEFTHYRRDFILKAGPNVAQKALGDFERYLREEGKGRNLTIITMNTDGLHVQAGNTKVIEMYGSLFKTQCMKCGEVRENRQQPICPSLAGKGDPVNHDYVEMPEDALPHCSRPGCNGCLRPYIVFEGEDITKAALDSAEDALRSADLCMVIGTSSTAKPMFEYAPTLAGRDVPVAEFNLLNTDVTMYFPYQFKGNCSETLPRILKF